MQNLSKKLLTATIVLITAVAALFGVSQNVKANTAKSVQFRFNNTYDETVYINHRDVVRFDYSEEKLVAAYQNGNIIQLNHTDVYKSFKFQSTTEGGGIIDIDGSTFYVDNFIGYGINTGYGREGQIYITKDSNDYFKSFSVRDERQWSVSITFYTLTESTPAISGEHTVINNVDSPYTVDRITQIADIAAIDPHYGDLTDDIEIIRDDYTENKNKVGTFEIEYQVTNPFGISTNFVLLVANKDLTKPVISGPGTSSMSYTEDFVLSNLIAKFTVTDNHDTNVKLELESTTHVPGVPGVYVFKFFAKDSSNNIATFNHTLTIVDDVKPTITDTNEGVIRVNWRDNVTNEILLMHLTAHDAIDGDLTESIQVIENNIKSTVGNYTVKYQVTDSAGNSGLYTRTYEVVTTDAPVFWVSANLLLISEVNALTNQQLADELAGYEGINIASHMMILNEYEGNENVPGTYMVRLAINDTLGEEHIVERTIEVFSDDELPELELSFWKKAWNVVVSVWEFIVKVFTWIWNAIKWVFDYVFGWIN